MNRVRCKNCGEWVLFVVTATRGRPMPVNPAIVRVHLVTEREATEADREAKWRKTVVIMLDGQCIRGYALPSPRPPSVTIVGRISHYVTCPHATSDRDRLRAKKKRETEGATDAPR